MTLEELCGSIRQSIGSNTRVHIRVLDGIEVQSSLVLEALEQIKLSVALCAADIEDPKAHRAEALLMILLDPTYTLFHGYTPKKDAAE
jgi:hypothetical protein